MEQSATNNEVVNKEEISLKDIILTIKSFISYTKKRWKPIALVGFIGALLGIGYSFWVSKKYIAEITFVLEDSKSSQLGAYAGLASQFGIDLSNGLSGSGVFEGDNILQFLKSRLMVEKALLSPVNSDTANITLAELYIEFKELRKTWEGKPMLQNVTYPVGHNRQRFTLQQDSILGVVYNDIVEKNLKVTKPDKALSFISVECTSENEIFSKIFAERLVKEVTQFYVETKTKRNRENVLNLQGVADSLENLLNRKTYAVAASQDVNLNPVKQIGAVSTELQLRDKMILQTIFGEVTKNLELSKMVMVQETPLIQIVDVPRLPLETKKMSKLKGLIFGGCLGLFCALCYFILRKVYENIMSN